MLCACVSGRIHKLTPGIPVQLATVTVEDGFQVYSQEKVEEIVSKLEEDRES